VLRKRLHSFHSKKEIDPKASPLKNSGSTDSKGDLKGGTMKNSGSTADPKGKDKDKK